MYISIDAGGTNTRIVGSRNLESPTFSADPVRWRNTHDFDNDLELMIQAALLIAGDEKIEALGVGTPGDPNETKTEIKRAQNLGSWVCRPLVTSLSEGLGGCPVFYDNDLVSAGLGEAYYGNTSDDFDYIIWGTGIGGGKVRKEGSKINVTELDWDTHFKQWEEQCGGASLTGRFRKPNERLSVEEWEEINGEFRNHLESYVEAVNPKVIIFAGGLAVKHANMIDETAKDLGVDMKISSFGEDSGLMGGFGLIRNRY